jgi:hypothetical protein
MPDRRHRCRINAAAPVTERVGAGRIPEQSWNKGGEVLDRVERGERVIVTRDGRAVAELRPLARRRIPSTA